MKVVLFGATGMVGAGVALECLDDPAVTSLVVVGRRSCGLTHPKLLERIVPDLSALDAIARELAGCDACFFCVGVTSVGLDEAAYRRLTYDVTMSVAAAVYRAAPGATFVYVSGTGTDSTERGRSMWARVKGKTENDLMKLGFRSAYMFRPGFIQPMRGVRSKTSWYRVLYALTAPLTPILMRVAPSYATTTVDVGRAMIAVAKHGYGKPILESLDIAAAARGGGGAG